MFGTAATPAAPAPPPAHRHSRSSARRSTARATTARRFDPRELSGESRTCSRWRSVDSSIADAGRQAPTGRPASWHARSAAAGVGNASTGASAIASSPAVFSCSSTSTSAAPIAVDHVGEREAGHAAPPARGLASRSMRSPSPAVRHSVDRVQTRLRRWTSASTRAST